MARPNQALMLVAVALAATALSRLAVAESAVPSCNDYLIRVTPVVDDLTIPANAPALAVWDSGTWWDVAFELLSPQGESLEVSVDDDPFQPYSSARLLRFAAPLVEGQGYELRWTQDCIYTYPAPKQLHGVRRFHVGPPVPWPSPPGTITATAHGANRVDVSVRFSPELLAFLPVASVDIMSGTAGGIARNLYGDYAQEVLLTYFDLSCLHQGLVQDSFILQAHVAGIADDPAPAEAAFEYTCPDLPAVDAGPGADDAATSGLADTGSLADGPDGIGDAPQRSSGAGGCATRDAGGEPRRWWWLAAIVGAIAVRGRKRHTCVGFDRRQNPP